MYLARRVRAAPSFWATSRIRAMAKDVPSTRPLIDKLGVKPGMRVAVIGIADTAFLELLQTRTSDVSVDHPKTAKDLIFLEIASRRELRQLAKQTAQIRQNGAIWAVYPKGVQTVTEREVREAGLAAGLVDNKVVSFSLSHTALRFVIPLARRVKE